MATTEDWFDAVFKSPNEGWIWCPLPALAKLAVEQLCLVRHLYPNSSHIFVCPALMRGYWLKTLGKVADSVFSLKAGSSLWDKDMFEPLTIAFVKPLLVRPPFKVGRSASVGEWESKMSDMQWHNTGLVRHHMRKFWNSRKPGNSVSKCVPRTVLRATGNINVTIILSSLSRTLMIPSWMIAR